MLFPSMSRAILTSVIAVLAGLSVAQENSSTDGLKLQVPSPAWQDQVIYMLFIDRFDDGDGSNNDQGHGEFDPGSGAHFSGGDFDGIIRRLDYLKSLGITAIWISPPVANQWWSTPYRATGWHGYWAVNFLEVDAHFGSLEDYRRLSHELHCRGMYLIQDVVANHTANFYTYDGGYDPSDTAKNFRLLEPDSHQPAPTQPPFDLIDRRNPDHAAANIYHWTPTLQDYTDRHQETQYMLGQLADLNTENPVVIRALKDTYKYWISEVGVDAFRVDTVMLVDHEFWNRFLHDDDGIYAHARQLGKDHFLTFGESVSISEPYRDEGERKLKGYIGSRENPYLNSMLGYPLYFEINRVLGRGQPTRQLGYRLELSMTMFDDPFSIPNFIDNHDTPRFLTTANVPAFEQALALLFTVPGIPIIYQGTEQAMKETRNAMFRGGFHNDEGSFNPDSRAYGLIGTLSGLRRSNPILTRGDLRVLASETAGAGVFAYRRTLEGRSVTVLMNTAGYPVLAHRLDLGTGAGGTLTAAFTLNSGDRLEADSTGLVTTVLPPRSVFCQQYPRNGRPSRGFRSVTGNRHYAAAERQHLRRELPPGRASVGPGPASARQEREHGSVDFLRRRCRGALGGRHTSFRSRHVGTLPAGLRCRPEPAVGTVLLRDRCPHAGLGSPCRRPGGGRCRPVRQLLEAAAAPEPKPEGHPERPGQDRWQKPGTDA